MEENGKIFFPFCKWRLHEVCLMSRGVLSLSAYFFWKLLFKCFLFLFQHNTMGNAIKTIIMKNMLWEMRLVGWNCRVCSSLMRKCCVINNMLYYLNCRLTAKWLVDEDERTHFSIFALTISFVNPGALPRKNYFLIKDFLFYVIEPHQTPCLNHTYSAMTFIYKSPNCRLR